MNAQQDPPDRPPAASPPPERGSDLSPQVQAMVDRSLGRTSSSSHGNPVATTPDGRAQWERDLATIKAWVVFIGLVVAAGVAAGLLVALTAE